MGAKRALQHPTLVQSQKIDDDEHRRLVALEYRHQEFGDDVDRKRRPVALKIFQPARIMLLDVSRKLAMHVGIKTLQRFIESHLAGGSEINVPAHQLVVAIDPSSPIEIAIALQLDCAESLHETACYRLLTDARALENPRHYRQHLSRIDRLDEIIANVGADRFLERRIFFALGDHHYGKSRGDLAHIAVDFEPAFPRHLLIEQQDVERTTPQQLYRVVGVGRPLYGIAFGAKEDAVRLQQLTFVVHPEYRFWGVKDRRGHKSECSRGSSPCLDSECARPAALRSCYPRFSVPRVNRAVGAGIVGRRPGNAARVPPTGATLRRNSSSL